MGKVVTAINTPNETNNFMPIDVDNNWSLERLPFKASTAIEEWSAIWIEISGNTTTWYVTAMGVENASWADFVWILAEPIVATDTDYATAGKLKAVWCPKNINAKATFTVWAWTFTAVDVFKTVEVHSDSKSLAVDTAWKWARIWGYTSSTKGVCKFLMPNTETA